MGSKKWRTYMRRKGKRHHKNFQMIESTVIKTGTMSALSKPFERLPTMYVKDCGYIPVVLTNAAFVIEKNITTKNLFQTQGNISKINSTLNRLAAPRLSKMKDDNVHDIIEAMKTFLVRLPDPLLPENVCEDLMTASQEEDSSVGAYITVLTKFRNSSPHNFAILHFMMQLLKKISEHSEQNCMDVQKLATVFVLDVIKPLKLEDSQEQGVLLIERLPYMIMMVENIIKQVDVFKTVTNMKQVVPSPKASIASMAKSRSAISPRGCRSSGTSDQRPQSETRDSSHTSRYDDITEISSKSEDSVESKNNIKNIFENRNRKKVASTSLQLCKRAVSEPHACIRPVEVCKRCATDVPVQFKSTAPRVNHAVSDASKSTKDFHLSKDEATLNSVVTSLDQENNVTQNPPITAKEVNEKKSTISGTSTFGWKKTRGAAATMSVSRKKLSKKEQDETSHNTSDVKSNKSTDKKVSSTADKRKRKSRSTSKKSKHEQERNVLDSFCRTSDFTTFQPDEEITPWNEGSTNSDDPSVMVKTIRNPRILAYQCTSPVKTELGTDETKVLLRSNERVLSSQHVSQMFLVNSWFRTISSQNKMSVRSETSEPSTSSATSYCRNIAVTPEPEEYAKCSSHETTPISKELIRGVRLKGSIGVNTSPCPQTCTTPLEECQNLPKVSQTCNSVRAPISPKVHPQVETLTTPRTNRTEYRKNLNLSQLNHPCLVSPLADYRSSIRGYGSASGLMINNPPCQSLRLIIPGSIMNRSAKSDTAGPAVRFRKKQVLSALKCPSCILQEKGENNLMRYVQSQGIPFGEWFIDILLVCITLCCISLIFLYHEYGKQENSW